MVWVFLILIFFAAFNSITKKGQRKIQKNEARPRNLPPKAREFLEIPRHPNEKPMTKREAQIWRKMQRVVTDDWAKIGVMSPGNVNAFTPGKAYYGVVVHVYGSGRIELTSVGLGNWEADFSQDGRVGIPRRTEKE
jgi:hypothetical protein